MTIRLLECRWLLPDTACTVLFAGAADEVVPAFSVHAASAHGQILDEELAARLAGDSWLTPLGGQALRAALAALNGQRAAPGPGADTHPL
jgi:hypothetical protein